MFPNILLRPPLFNRAIARNLTMMTDIHLSKPLSKLSLNAVQPIQQSTFVLGQVQVYMLEISNIRSTMMDMLKMDKVFTCHKMPQEIHEFHVVDHLLSQAPQRLDVPMLVVDIANPFCTIDIQSSLSPVTQIKLIASRPLDGMTLPLSPCQRNGRFMISLTILLDKSSQCHIEFILK